MFPTKGEMFPRRKSIFQGGDMPSESSHEEEVAKKGENKRGSWFQGEAKSSLDGGKHPSKRKQFLIDFN